MKMLFAYEEAIGFCIGNIVRDKDGVSAAAVFAEMAHHFYKERAAINGTSGGGSTKEEPEEPSPKRRKQELSPIAAELLSGGHFFDTKGVTRLRFVGAPAVRRSVAIGGAG